jgi:hypothetical protein
MIFLLFPGFLVPGLLRGEFMENIRLHPKHGIPPVIIICGLCGKEKKELLLLGNNAPKNYKEYGTNKVVDVGDPCDECKKEYLKSGVLLIEVDSERINPTGNLMVIRNEAFNIIFNHDYPENKIVQVEIGVLDKIKNSIPSGEDDE